MNKPVDIVGYFEDVSSTVVDRTVHHRQLIMVSGCFAKGQSSNNCYLFLTVSAVVVVTVDFVAHI